MNLVLQWPLPVRDASGIDANIYVARMSAPLSVHTGTIRGEQNDKTIGKHLNGLQN